MMNSTIKETAEALSYSIDELVKDVGDQLVEELKDDRDPCLIGIQKRGDILATRLQNILQTALDIDIPVGGLDITIYRDDFDSLSDTPVVGTTHINFTVNDRTVVLVDDVIYTGRTIRAAIEEILEFGRPKRILLAVLIDRGWRELPISPDIIGCKIKTSKEGIVNVFVKELDGKDEVHIVNPHRQV